MQVSDVFNVPKSRTNDSINAEVTIKVHQSPPGRRMDSLANLISLVAIVASAFGALIIFAASQLATARDRQREEYAKALQTVVKWTEMPYRIRRRNASDQATMSRLIDAMHALQEEIAFHDAWISVEAPEVATAYRALVNKAKAECEDHLRNAWKADHSPPTPMNIGNLYPVEFGCERETYVEAVRYHLEWLGIRRRIPGRTRKDQC
jgi:hypothetical protein